MRQLSLVLRCCFITIIVTETSSFVLDDKTMENMEDDSDDGQIYFFDATKLTLCEMEDYDLSGEESEN